MSVITDSLRKIAQDMSESAAWNEIRDAAVGRLTEEGMQVKVAEELVDGLSEGVEGVSTLTPTELTDILLKTASYVDELEAKIRTSETEMSDKDRQLAKVAEEQVMDAMSSFIEKGFSEEEVRSLAANVSEETLHKLANVQVAPSPLGQGAGQDRDSMDPIMAFLMS